MRIRPPGYLRNHEETILSATFVVCKGRGRQNHLNLGLASQRQGEAESLGCSFSTSPILPFCDLSLGGRLLWAHVLSLYLVTSLSLSASSELQGFGSPGLSLRPKHLCSTFVDDFCSFHVCCFEICLEFYLFSVRFNLNARGDFFSTAQELTHNVYSSKK